MSKAEVEKVMGSYMVGTAWPSMGNKTMTLIGTRRVEFAVDTRNTMELVLKDCQVYRHSNEKEYNSDWGIVCFDKNGAEHVDFAPD